MGTRPPFTTMLVLAVFVLSAAVIWLAYGDTGAVPVDGEPPLIKAAAAPLKVAPDDPGGRAVAELGGVGDLMGDQPTTIGEERLLPGPEQPLTPEQAAVRTAVDGAPSRAAAALDALVAEVRDRNGPVDGGIHLPSPSKPDERRAVGAGPSRSAGAEPNRPESRAPAGAATEIRTAAVDSRALPGAPLVEPSPDGRYRVQLAAVRAEADARRAWALFQVQLGALLGGLDPLFERAETSNGVFYRVQVGPFAAGRDADTLCTELKKQNASCFVVSR